MSSKPTGRRRTTGSAPLLELTRELVGAASPGEADRTLCRTVAAADRYRFAWIGDAVTGDGVRPRASAGVEGDGGGGSEPPHAELAGRALRAGASRVEGAGGSGSVAAVPLSHDGSSCGVLVVGTARGRRLRERERDRLESLARTAAFVVKSLRRRELLFADAAVSLSFELRDRAVLPVALSGALDCEVALAGYVASGSRWTAYLDVDGADADAVVAQAATDPSVGRARPVAWGRDDDRVEVVLDGPSLLGVVEAAGGSVERAVGDGGRGRVVVEVPSSADVRRVVERVRTAYDAELVARRELDRGVAAGELPGDLLDELTDRQLEVLRGAYRAGYFEWPRGSTAEEVAASLDITAPTLHGHLRKAEQAIFRALFERGG